MGKKKSSKAGGEGHYFATQRNLDAKGRTNKKLKRNPMASKYLTPKGQEIIDVAKAYAAEHPKGTGRKYRKMKETSN